MSKSAKVVLEAVRKVAKKSPEPVAIAARICPNDVRLTLEQAIPGGMSLEDYSLMRGLLDFCVWRSHGQGRRPSGQSNTAIKIATTTTKLSVSAVVIGRIRLADQS